MHETWETVMGHASRRWAWFKEKATTKSAYLWLGVYSFFETIIIPFPTDPFLAIMVHADRRRVVWLTLWTTVTSLAAALVGYVIALAAYDSIGAPLAAAIGISDQVTQAAATFDSYTFIATFIGAASPIPFAPIILAAGLLKANIVVFALATLIGRGIRFAIISLVTVFFGVSILPRLGKVAVRITIVFVILALLVALMFIVR